MKALKYYIFSFVLISILIIGVNALMDSHDKEIESNKLSMVVKQSVNGWIYEIYADKKLIIKQETIPSISGNYYFNNKRDAEKIGYLVLNKLNKGVMPPTVSTQEIKNSKITIIE